jgi:hypothetical protein
MFLASPIRADLHRPAYAFLGEAAHCLPEGLCISARPFDRDMR